MSELILQASGVKTSISEAAQSNGTLANSGVGLTVAVTGKVSGGTVANNGTVTILGANTATSVGTAVTVVLTPSFSTADGKVIWACSTGNTAIHKYMPSECRH